MKEDYFNSHDVILSDTNTMVKWYEVARSRDNRLIKKLDEFAYISMARDNLFELLYVTVDELNCRVTRSYHGKIVSKSGKNYLIIRRGLFRHKLLILSYDEKAGLVALSNRFKTKVRILSSCLPVDNDAFQKMMNIVSEHGFDVNDIELLYD